METMIFMRNDFHKVLFVFVFVLLSVLCIGVPSLATAQQTTLPERTEVPAGGCGPGYDEKYTFFSTRPFLRTQCVLTASTDPTYAVRNNGIPARSCTFPSYTFEGCIWIPLTTNLSSGSIAINAWLLTSASSLLNQVIDTTVVSFNNSIYAKINNSSGPVSLNIVWAVFRDFANIAILGAFTFIAISIILGRVTFNNKRLVANILVAALLINFSLVFSRVIIQASSLFSCQFYKVIVVGATSCDPKLPSQATEGASTTVTSDGISGHFLRIIGVEGFAGTKSALDKLANSDNGWTLVLIHGLFTSVFLGVATLTFTLMALMLIVRTIMLVFLMAISPLAFAAYAIPKWSHRFSDWWESLIKQSFLAPLLLMFLWMSSAFAGAIAGEKGVIGEVLASPEKASAGYSVFVYLFIIGLLLVSAYLSLKFASSIAGVSWAPALAALPVVGASLGIGSGLRNTLGRANYLEQMRLEKTLKDAKGQGDHELALKTMQQLKTVKAKTGREYNFMNNFSDKTLQKMGLTGAFAGQTKGGGFAGRLDTKAKEISTELKGVAMSGKDTDTLAKTLAEKAHQESPELKEKQQMISEQRKVVDEQKEATKAMRESATRQLKFAEENAKSTIDKHQDELRSGLQQARTETDTKLSETTDATQKQVIMKAHDQQVKQIHESINQKTANAHADVKLALDNLNRAHAPVTAAQKELDQHESDLARIKKDLERTAKTQATNITTSYSKALEEAIAKKEGSPLVVDKVKKLWGKADKEEKWKDRFGVPPAQDKKEEKAPKDTPSH